MQADGSMAQAVEIGVRIGTTTAARSRVSVWAGSAGESPWHSRQDIMQWLEDL
jgi:hypothetical protein